MVTLVYEQDGYEVVAQAWPGPLPEVIYLPNGRRVDGPVPGRSYGEYTLRVEDDTPPISKAQCLLWLLQLGKTEADIDAFIETLPEDEREPARIEWRHRPIFRHDHPLILAAADEFGIPRSYLPDAFRDAADL